MVERSVVVSVIARQSRPQLSEKAREFRETRVRFSSSALGGSLIPRSNNPERFFISSSAARKPATVGEEPQGESESEITQENVEDIQSEIAFKNVEDNLSEVNQEYPK